MTLIGLFGIIIGTVEYSHAETHYIYANPTADDGFCFYQYDEIYIEITYITVKPTDTILINLEQAIYNHPTERIHSNYSIIDYTFLEDMTSYKWYLISSPTLEEFLNVNDFL